MNTKKSSITVIISFILVLLLAIGACGMLVNCFKPDISGPNTGNVGVGNGGTSGGNGEETKDPDDNTDPKDPDDKTDPTDDTYTVTFNVEGNTSIVSAVTVKRGKQVARPADPEREDYVFDGWYTSSSFNTKYDFTSVVMSNRTLYGRFCELLTVTFVLDGNIAAVPRLVGIIPNSHITLPSPELNNRYLDGWYKNTSFEAGAKWNEGVDIVTEDITLYGRSLELHHIEFFIVDAGSEGDAVFYSSQDVPQGFTCQAPNVPSESGYTFDGWYTSSAYETKYDFTTPVTVGGTLYGRYVENEPEPEPETYTVSFYIGEELIETRTVQANSLLSEPDEPYMDEDHTFSCWVNHSMTVNGGHPSWDFDTDRVTMNLTLKAAFAHITYILTLHILLPDGSEDIITRSQLSGEMPSIPLGLTPPCDGYDFDGWYTDSAYADKFSRTTILRADKTLYGRYVAVPQYTVTFLVDGSLWTSATVNEGNKVSRPATPSKAGHYFSGWYTDTTYSVSYSFSTPVTANTTVYGKFIPITTYTVTFDVDGDTTLVPSVTVYSGDTVTRPTDPVQSGYTFDGWYYDADFQTPYLFTASVTSNMTLYGHFVQGAPPSPGDDIREDLYDYSKALDDGSIAYFVDESMLYGVGNYGNGFELYRDDWSINFSIGYEDDNVYDNAFFEFPSVTIVYYVDGEERRVTVRDEREVHSGNWEYSFESNEPIDDTPVQIYVNAEAKDITDRIWIEGGNGELAKIQFLGFARNPETGETEMLFYIHSMFFDQITSFYCWGEEYSYEEAHLYGGFYSFPIPECLDEFGISIMLQPSDEDTFYLDLTTLFLRNYSHYNEDLEYIKNAYEASGEEFDINEPNVKDSLFGGNPFVDVMQADVGFYYTIYVDNNGTYVFDYYITDPAGNIPLEIYDILLYAQSPNNDEPDPTILSSNIYPKFGTIVFDYFPSELRIMLISNYGD